MRQILTRAVWCGLAASLCLLNCSPALSASGFQKTFAVTLQDLVVLDIMMAKGNVTIAYSRDGQVSITAIARDGRGKDVSSDFFETTLTFAQTGNHIQVLNVPTLNTPDIGLDISYRVDVPTRTQVSSVIFGTGNQTVIGIYGPATLITGTGDIDATYIRPGLLRAQTGRGKIACTRVSELEVETGSGNITLVEDGRSKASVKKGFGRIEVGGARSSVTGVTDKGDIHIRAELWDDWQLTSASGNIRIELPPKSKFEADLSTQSGEIAMERAGMNAPADRAREYHQKVNGGGRSVRATSGAGSILIE